MNTFWLVALWLIYFFFHSLLASDRLKDLAYAHTFLGPRSYRLIYSLISIFGLLYIVFFVLVTPASTLIKFPAFIRYLALIFTSWGVMLIMISFRHISTKAFLGLVEDNEELIFEGLHRHVRHPIYSGTILIVIGMVLYMPTDLALASALSILFYLPFGIYFEEQKLLKKFGEKYEDYKNTVPAIFPKIF